MILQDRPVVSHPVGEQRRQPEVVKGILFAILAGLAVVSVLIICLSVILVAGGSNSESLEQGARLITAMTA